MTDSGILHQLLPAYIYSIYWNVLGVPAGTIPICLINNDEALYKESANSVFNDSYTYVGKTVMKGSAGMPVGI